MLNLGERPGIRTNNAQSDGPIPFGMDAAPAIPRVQPLPRAQLLRSAASREPTARSTWAVAARG